MKKRIFTCLLVAILLFSAICVPVSADWESDLDTEGTGILGDFDYSGAIDNRDVEYLLWHTLFPDDYPLFGSGEMDGTPGIDNRDVEYLLWHTLMPTDYEVNQNVDFDDNGIVDDEDVIYLLWHTLMPDDYPL